MNLKTYQAFSMAEALAAVKRDLGRDAVILHTRSFRKGGFLGMGGRQMWEITASRNVNVAAPRTRRPVVTGLEPEAQTPLAKAVAKAAAKPAARAAGRDVGKSAGVAVIDGPAELVMSAAAARVASAGAYGGTQGRAAVQSVRSEVEEDRVSQQVQALAGMVEKLVRQHEDADRPAVPEELFEFYLELVQQEVAEDIAKELLEKLRSQLTGEQLKNKTLIREKLMEFVATMIPTTASAPTGELGRPRVIALIGPTGVGKTTTIAKLAANLKLRENRRVGLITIDTYRIAAVDQLRTYAQIIDVPLKVILTPEELAEAIAEMSDVDVILIDTAGRSQNDTMRLAQLEEFLAAAHPDEVHLVLSTTANQRNVQAAMEKFGHLGVDKVILTKLDEAVSFGMILNIVRQMNAALSYVTTGQDVPDDIEISEGRKIARLIIGGGSGSC